MLIQWITNFAVVHDVLVYGVIYILAFIQGDLVSLVSGVLARLGYIGPFVAGAAVICGKLTGDVILYWLGRRLGESFVLKYGKHFSITDKTVAFAKDKFAKYHSIILLGSKLTNGLGVGFAFPILFTAGMTRMSFGKYMAISVFGEIIWTGIMVYIGYFFGNLYITVNNDLFRASMIGVVVAVLVGLFLFLRTLRRKLDNLS